MDPSLRVGVPCVASRSHPPRILASSSLQAAGAQGSTAPPPADQEVDLHFIAFVEHKGE